MIAPGERWSIGNFCVMSALDQKQTFCAAVKKRRYFDHLDSAPYSALMPAAFIGVARADRTNRPSGRGARRAEAFGGLGLVPLSKSPTHVDPRQTRLDIELRFQHTMGFDKSHMGVHREILCHCHIGAQLDSG